MKSRLMTYDLRLTTGLLVLTSLMLSGCVVRTYPLVKDRVDQDLTAGNRGYLQGQPPQAMETTERKHRRTTQVVEVELYSPIRFEKMPMPKAGEESQDNEIYGNKGYITQNTPLEIAEPESSTSAGNFEKYTVQKNDTLQKISQKFYGTTKRWPKIYEVNKDILKGPNKIYKGQVLNIPVKGLKETKEGLKETKENLK